MALLLVPLFWSGGLASEPGGPPLVVITDGNFSASPFPWGLDFTGMSPLPDRAGEQTGAGASSTTITSANPSGFMLSPNAVGDALFLKDFAPKWRAPPGARVTQPWTNGFSAPRLLGGLATYDPVSRRYIPNYDFEVVTRDAGGRLIYNWTRIDATIDGFLHSFKYTKFLLVLDNIPYAFVKPSNRYYLGYGLGSAPDDPEEFATFVGAFAAHLVERYGLEVVSHWRFRLGTECDGPRIGPSWENFTAPNPPFVMPNENGGNFTTRVNGLEVYTQTYIAVAKALKAVVPLAAFGPSNMAGISGGANGGGTGEMCTSCHYLNIFADRVKAAGAPLDFIAASEYSKWDANGLTPVRPMRETPAYLAGVARRAGHPSAPVEIHEWGWATWGHYAKDFGKVSCPDGVYGGAWDLGSLLYQRQGGASRVFHWGNQEDSSLNRGKRGAGGNASQTCMPGTIWCSRADEQTHKCTPTCRQRGYPLVTAHGWLLSALFGLSSSTMNRTRTAELSEFVSDIIQMRSIHLRGPHRASYNHTIGGIKSSRNDKISYLILHFSPNSTERMTRQFRLDISAGDAKRFRSKFGDEPVGSACSGLSISYQTLNRTTSVHDLIEDELYEKGQKIVTEMRSVDMIANMATAKGLRDLSDHAEKWMLLNRMSMEAVPFNGVAVDTPGGGCSLYFTLETPSLQLIHISKKP